MSLPSESPSPPSDPDAWHLESPFWLLAITVVLATFMEVLDTSVMVVALPQIAGALSASVNESTWVLTSYLVSNAIVLPLSGWFSELLGRKRFFMICVALFVAASLLCGFSTSLTMLVFCRILQGAGGGALQPISQAILVESSPRQRRGMAMAVFGMGVVVAPIVGPTLGGWITDNYSWRWVFFLNLPFGLLSLILTWLVIRDPPYLVPKGLRGGLRIDYIGLGLLAVGLGSLQVVLDKGQRADWFDSTYILVLAIVAGVALLATVAWELFQKDPVLDLRLFTERNFSFSTIAMFVLGFVLYGSISLLPILLETLLGYTSTLAGLVLTPGGIVTLITMPIVGWLLSRFEARWMMIIGIATIAAALLLMSHFNLQMGFSTAVIARMIQGAGLAFLFVPINVAAFHFIANERTNYGTGLINLARNVGGSAGIAFATTVVARRTQVHQNMLVEHISEFNETYRQAFAGGRALLLRSGSGSYHASEQAQALIAETLHRQASILAFLDAFRWLAVVALITMPLLLLMKRADPRATDAPMAHG